MSNNDVKPYNFIKFEEADISSEDPLVKFKIDRPKNFIPQFNVDTKYDFKPLFSEKGELTKDAYRKKVEEYYEEKKRELEEKLNKYFEEKKKEAEEIVNKAKQEEAVIKEKAYKEGFSKGYEEGFKKGEEELKNAIFNFTKIIENLKNFEEDVIKKHEQSIVNIILKIVKKIIKSELKANPEEILINNLKEVLKKIIDKGFLEIKINPEDYDLVSQYMKKIRDIQDIRELNISKSEDIPRGSCIIETNYGTYDGRIDEQIQEIEKVLSIK